MATTTGDASPLGHVKQSQPLIIIASSLGAVFEWYDFYLYGLLATIITAQFFSGVNETTGFIFALAAFAGVLAAPIYQVNPLMGSDLIIVVFAIVVIGGMGSILGSIVTGLGLGIVEGLTKVFYAEASSTVIFVIMAIVLLIRPAGLFGRTR